MTSSLFAISVVCYQTIFCNISQGIKSWLYDYFWIPFKMKITCIRDSIFQRNGTIVTHGGSLNDWLWKDFPKIFCRKLTSTAVEHTLHFRSDGLSISLRMGLTLGIPERPFMFFSYGMVVWSETMKGKRDSLCSSDRSYRVLSHTRNVCRKHYQKCPSLFRERIWESHSSIL